MAGTFAEFPDRGDMRAMADLTVKNANRYRKREYVRSMTPGAVTAGSVVSVSLTVPVTIDQNVIITGQSQDAGMVVDAVITAADSVRVDFNNTTAGSITPPSGDYRVRVFD